MSVEEKVNVPGYDSAYEPVTLREYRDITAAALIFVVGVGLNLQIRTTQWYQQIGETLTQTTQQIDTLMYRAPKPCIRAMIANNLSPADAVEHCDPDRRNYQGNILSSDRERRQPHTQ